MTTLKKTTDTSFDVDVLCAPTTVIVDFWAEWCPPSRAVAPVLERIAADHPEVAVLAVNADDNMASAARYHAMALSTIKVFQRGEVVKTIVGAKPQHALEAELAPFLDEVGASIR